MRIGGNSFSSAFFSSLQGSGLSQLDGLAALGQLDARLLSGGFDQLDRMGGCGGLGRDLVKGLFAAAGFNALKDVARALSKLQKRGLKKAMRGCCGSGGKRDPMKANRLDGDLGKGIGGAAKANGKDSAMARLPKGACFEDLVAAFMMDEVKKMQEEVKKEMAKLKSSNETNGGQGKSGAGGAGKSGGGAGGAGGAGGDPNGDSRQLMFENLKNMMNKLQQMIQSMSNVLNTMHQGAMNSIRAIKGN